MSRLLARLRGRPEIVIECRRCGTSVAVAEGACPTCGGSGFAEYVIPV